MLIQRKVRLWGTLCLGISYTGDAGWVHLQPFCFNILPLGRCEVIWKVNFKGFLGERCSHFSPETKGRMEKGKRFR